MKQSTNFSQFCDAFRDTGHNDNFSYAAKRALFDFLEQMGDDSGTEYELDVITLCCEFQESTTEEVAADYRLDIEGLDEDETEEAVRKYLNDNTMLVGEVSGGFVFACF